jgi:phosphonate transport system substrate-binding protein
VGMSKDPEGRKILNDGAELLKIKEELGFVAAENRDYDNYRTFYRQTQVK